MGISFNQIPTGTLIPFFFIEFDNSVANSGSVLVPWTVCLIGQKIAAGNATVEELIEITADGIVDFKGSYDEYLRSQGIAEAGVQRAVA